MFAKARPRDDCPIGAGLSAFTDLVRSAKIKEKDLWRSHLVRIWEKKGRNVYYSLLLKKVEIQMTQNIVFKGYSKMIHFFSDYIPLSIIIQY